MSHLDEGTLHAMLDGELEPNDVAEIQAHLASCSSCGLRLREVREFLDEADRLIASVEMDGAAAAPMRRLAPVEATPEMARARAGAERTRPRAGPRRAGPQRAVRALSHRVLSHRAPRQCARERPSEPRSRRAPSAPRAASPPRATAGARPARRQGDLERAAAPAPDARQRIGRRPAHAAGPEVRLGGDDRRVRRRRLRRHSPP